MRARRLLRRGLGLVEAQIALAISAMLLTAVATAFQASSDAIQMNDNFFRATQSGRVSLARILAHVRRGTVDESSTISNIRILTETGQDLTYKMDSANNRLMMVTNDITTDSDFVLARNVTQAQFLIEMGKDSNNTTCVSRVSVAIWVKVGDEEVRLVGSASPRRNLSY